MCQLFLPGRGAERPLVEESIASSSSSSSVKPTKQKKNNKGVAGVEKKLGGAAAVPPRKVGREAARRVKARTAAGLPERVPKMNVYGQVRNNRPRVTGRGVATRLARYPTRGLQRAQTDGGTMNAQASESSADYLPRIFQDNFVGVKVSPDHLARTRDTVKTATYKLQKSQLGYVPWSALFCLGGVEPHA
jgi:hypothetical protein